MFKKQKIHRLKLIKEEYRLEVLYKQNNLNYCYGKNVEDSYGWEHMPYSIRCEKYKNQIFCCDTAENQIQRLVKNITSGKTDMTINGNIPVTSGEKLIGNKKILLMPQNIIDIYWNKIGESIVEFEFNKKQIKAVSVFQNKIVN